MTSKRLCILIIIKTQNYKNLFVIIQLYPDLFLLGKNDIIKPLKMVGRNMIEHLIIYIALFLIYFHIGGLATTNIIRLTKGNSSPVLASKCICDNCGSKIPPLLQLPVISFIICKGKCKNCKIKIPLYPLILELATMLGMFLISIAFKLSVLGITISFVYYEILRLLVVCIKGKRDSHFAKNYIIAILSMIPFYLLTLFVSLIYSLI